MCGCQVEAYLFKMVVGRNPVVICPGSSFPSASLGEITCVGQDLAKLEPRHQSRHGAKPWCSQEEPGESRSELCPGREVLGMPWREEVLQAAGRSCPCSPHQGSQLKARLASRSQGINACNDLLGQLLLC